MIYRKQDNPDSLTIGEAATYTGLSPATLRRYDTIGRLRPERNPGGQRRYTRTALDHFLKGRTR